MKISNFKLMRHEAVYKMRREEIQVEMPDFNKMWAEALKREDGTWSPRQRDDGEERAFWKRFMEKKHGYVQDDSARQITERLRKLLEGVRRDTILEIGPGWGNYTVGLSKLCRRLTCVDLSPDVLNFIERITQEEQCRNVETVCAKWEDYTEQEQYDVVFGYNCFYRMHDLRACMEKMNRVARELCIMGMGMGEMPPAYLEMERELGLSFHFGKKDYIYFVNILYQMGIDGALTVLPFQRRQVYDSWEEAVRQETRFLRGQEEALHGRRAEIEEILRRHLIRRGDGAWEAVHQFRGALLSWQPAEVRDRREIRMYDT